MAFDAFVKFDDIDGESTDEMHTDWIEILSFSMGMSQPASATASSAGGATSGRVDVQDVVLTKHLDKASPKLAEYCCTGDHVGKVVIEICRAGGEKLKYMEYKLSDVIVSSVQTGGSSGGDEVPTESVTLNFGKIEWTYTQQKRADGSGGGNVSGGWDLEKNQKI